MVFLSEYGLFFLKTITIVIGILVTLSGMIAISSKGDGRRKLKIKPLNDKLKEQTNRLLETTLSKEHYKKHIKAQKKEAKSEKNLDTPDKKSIYVIEFNGDISASEVTILTEAITSILLIAQKGDEVVIKIDSPGGAVNSYGLAAAQIQRLKQKELSITACIDKVAASGGYLMASVADKIIAAPFAYVGSIGVVAQLPNFHRLLKKHDVDVELITAGDHKRTLTVFGENTEEDRQRFTDNVESIHTAFKAHLSEFRPKLDLNTVANGDYWLASQALELNLVDALQTSDDYLVNQLKKANIFMLSKKSKPSIVQKLLKSSAKFILKQ